jgi:hypothetical protein
VKSLKLFSKRGFDLKVKFNLEVIALTLNKNNALLCTSVRGAAALVLTQLAIEDALKKPCE